MKATETVTPGGTLCDDCGASLPLSGWRLDAGGKGTYCMECVSDRLLNEPHKPHYSNRPRRGGASRRQGHAAPVR